MYGFIYEPTANTLPNFQVDFMLATHFVHQFLVCICDSTVSATKKIKLFSCPLLQDRKFSFKKAVKKYWKKQYLKINFLNFFPAQYMYVCFKHTAIRRFQQFCDIRKILTVQISLIFRAILLL